MGNRRSGFAEASKTQLATGLFVSLISGWVVMSLLHETVHWLVGFPKVLEICILGNSNGKFAWMWLEWMDGSQTPWWIDGYSSGLPVPLTTLIHFVGWFLLTIGFMYLLTRTRTD